MQVVDREQVSREILDFLMRHDLKKSKEMWTFLTTNEEITETIRTSNHLAVKYLHYTDHGLDHVTIVSWNVLQLLDVTRDEIMPAIVRHQIGDFDDVVVVCLTASYLHDIGHMIHRTFHELSSSLIVKEIIYSKLRKLYPNTAKRMQILSHIQHAILAHAVDVHCLTPEAGFVTIADGLDMTQGRSRKPYDLGKVDIHSISALSISEVEILKGTKKKPIRLNILMISEAGVFQVEEVFLPKLQSSGLADEVEINTLVNGKPIALSQVLRMYRKFEEL